MQGTLDEGLTSLLFRLMGLLNTLQHMGRNTFLPRTAHQKFSGIWVSLKSDLLTLTLNPDSVDGSDSMVGCGASGISRNGLRGLGSYRKISGCMLSRACQTQADQIWALYLLSRIRIHLT